MLDIVFALSCVGMLAALVWMFWKDHYREYKDVQRRGREVEVAVLRQEAGKTLEGKQSEVSAARERVVAQLKEFGRGVPDPDENFVENAKKEAARASNARIKNELMPDLDKKKAEQVKKQTQLAAEKANRDALVSERDILVQKHALPAAITAKEAEVVAKNTEIEQLTLDVERVDGEVKNLQDDVAKVRKPLLQAIEDLDRLTKEHDRLLRAAEQKVIGAGAKFRAWPIIDAFASPYRVQQHKPEGLLIDYNFKQVQRVDRCATCHMFIDRSGFEKDGLRELKEPQLSASEVAVYSTHPRLDLFVGSNSPHAIEKFACTVCHSGQGGAATFNFAYHFPDRGKTNGDKLEAYTDKRDRWKNDFHWHADLHPDYLWDFPMLPMRFVESTCLKCHHQVTDLIRTDGKEEAPKLLKGYRLVKELGCFGCHEIAGYKSGRPIGPDLRLEPYPPLDELTWQERLKLAIDPNDPPGTLRKVGPGLRRLAEKSNPEWTAKWIRSPRSFRPDTRMPHFFGLSNNTPGKLSDAHSGPSPLPPDGSQDGLADAEIRAATFYIFKESEAQLAGIKAAHELSQADWDQEQQVRQDFQRIEELRRDFLKIEELRRQNPQRVPRDPDPTLPAGTPVSKLASIAPDLREKLTAEQLGLVLSYFMERDKQRKAALPLDQRPYPPAELKDHKADAKSGEQLFKTRGCLACHTHENVKVYGNDGSLISKQEFGPNLRGLRDKLGEKGDRWLYHWIMDPTSYHSRTLMPNTQLEPKQAADIVAWLLGDGAVPPGDDWAGVQVKPLETDTLQKLARVYLDKALLKSKAAEAAAKGLNQADVAGLRGDADERILVNDPPAGSAVAMLKDHNERLQYYVGRKTIGRYGCYACHDIPGFETTKPIGTPLNDWGRKEADRLAFENILSYVMNHEQNVAQDVAQGSQASHGANAHRSQSVGVAGGYDPFFMDRLESHHREGFLYQKLKEPRSYDYDKLRSWDERLRMPQFKFSHAKQRQGESDEDFAKRAAKEEEEGVEAVMTFVLGLVADPVSMKFVNQPRQDRQNEVRGLQVLEKYNCVGCHVVKPGSYEFPLSYVHEGQTMKEQLEGWLSSKRVDLERDTGFPEHNAWKTQRIYRDGRAVARGIPFIVPFSGDEEAAKTATVEVWEAIRLIDKGETRQFPAGLNQLQIPLNPAWAQHPPMGGAFAEVLLRLLAERDNKQVVLDRKQLLGSVPPTLIREGQKVQAAWLLEFLRHPHEIRPAVGQNLKMPRFNLSDEEARALVDYFVAVDRLENPALGVEYLARRPKQRDPEFQREIQAQYAARIKSLAPAAADKADYFEAGYRLVTDNNHCRKCHNLGAFQAEGKPEEKGPNLDRVAERLRPEYVERWISNPGRLAPYTLMVQDDPFFADRAFAQQRAQLQNPAMKGLIQIGPLLAPHPGGPVLPVDDATYNQIMTEFALSPQEKLRLVRDALMSFGYLVDPPPTAKKAGKPADLHGDHR